MDRSKSSAGARRSLDDILEHHGILGMKWGVRRTREALAKRPKLPSSADHTKAHDTAKVVKRHGTRAVSNQELQTLVTRMNLEQQYSNLSSKSNQGSIKKGHAQIKTAVSIGKTANEVHSFVTSPTGKLLISGAIVAANAAKKKAGA